jgi:hypothetical protein
VKQYRPALNAYTIEMPAGELKWLEYWMCCMLK